MDQGHFCSLFEGEVEVADGMREELDLGASSPQIGGNTKVGEGLSLTQGTMIPEQNPWDKD